MRQPAGRLRDWWRDCGPGSASVACLIGPNPAVRARMLDEFTRTLPDTVEIIRLSADGDGNGGEGNGGEGAGAAQARLRGAFDDFILDTPAAAPRIVVLDDLDARPDGVGLVVQMASDAQRLAGGEVRIVIGAAARPKQIQHDSVLLISVGGYVQPRPALLGRIRGWVTDPAGPGTMLVLGAPGAGKSFLLKDAVRALDELPAVEVAFASIRAWSLGTPADAGFAELATGLNRALAADGLDIRALADSTLTNLPPRPVHVEQSIGVNYGEVTGVRFALPDQAAQAVESIVAALGARAAAGAASTTLVLVIDALDEWETYGLPGLGALRSLLSRHASFQGWNIKILLSSQYRPGWAPGGELLDLDSENAGPDLEAYALTVLAMAVPDEAERKALANRLVELSHGLFLVLGGYLDEFTAGELSAADLAEATPAGSAVEYCSESLLRIRRQHYEERGLQAQWLDAERFLSMLAVLPTGRGARDLGASWREKDVPTSQDWNHVRKSLADSPVRRYFAADEAGLHYRLSHPAVRQAVTALTPLDERTGPTAERRRWILRHTPIGRPAAAWDPVGGRLALAEVGTVLADLLRTAAQQTPDLDEHALAEARSWARTLLEAWSWLETSIAHGDPAASVPLGLPRVLQQIEAMTRADPGLADLELWLEPRPVSVPAPFPVPVSVPVPVPVPAQALGPAPTPEAAESADAAEADAPAAAGTVVQPAYQPTNTARLAWARDAVVAEVLNGNSTFATHEEARFRLHTIRRQYQMSRESNELRDLDQIILFVRDYGLGPEEIARGRKGRYVRFQVLPQPGDSGRWMIRADQHESVQGDPVQSTPVGRDFPNWSHPLLRRVAGNPQPYATREPKRFATQQDAEAGLKQLRDDYPRGAIMLPGKLLVRVYGRTGPVNPATGKRFVFVNTELFVVRVPAGFQIEARLISHVDSHGEKISHEDYLRLPRDPE